jgi:hypothetical protein
LRLDEALQAEEVRRLPAVTGFRFASHRFLMPVKIDPKRHGFARLTDYVVKHAAKRLGFAGGIDIGQ